MPPKLAALVVASSLTIGWVLASVVSPPVAKLQVLPERGERRVAAQDEPIAAPYTEQLHLKLLQAPLAPVPRRNPFVFGATRVPTPPAANAANAAKQSDSETQVVDAAAVSVVTGPSLRLSGIGSTSTQRTAVVSDGQTVHLVKVGETVGGYAVVEITDDSVTIADAAGAQWILRLK